VRDEDGKVTTVRYEAVNAMLLNESLKEHRKTQEQEAAIAQLKLTVARQASEFQGTTAKQQREVQALKTQLNEQATQIRAVTARLETSRLTPQIAATHRKLAP
jgi:hypothetical protein